MQRATSILVLAASILLAGCGARDASGPTTPDGSGGATIAFGAPIAVGAGGPEPVIAIAADDGTTYVAAQDAGNGAPHVFVSTDGGRSWRGSTPSSASGGEVDLAAGAGGVAYVTQLGTQGNIVSVTRDRGATWTPSVLGTTQYFDREWAAVDDAGSAYLVARDFQRSGAVLSRSDDGGVTFLARGAPWDAQHEAGLTDGNLVASGATLVLPYACRDGVAVCVATSGDRGVSWSQRVVASRSVGIDNVYPIAATSGATIVVVWSDASDGRLAVYGAISRDAGATWSTAPKKLSRDDETGTLAWVAARDGAWFVAYVTTSGAFGSADAPAARTAEWRIAVAKLDVGGDPLRVSARSGDAFGRAMHVGLISKPIGNPGGGPSDRRFGDLFTIAVDLKGRAVVTALDTSSGRRTTDWVVASS